TGAGQHGVASATVAARMGVECVVYMGAEDIERQAINVYRMRLLGATVVSVESGSRTLKDALNEAMRDWVTNIDNTFYIIGTVAGPHPYPAMVRDFQAIIGRETRQQIMAMEGRLPDALVACVGGGSNAIGLFHPFIDDNEVAIYGVEAGGDGVETGRHAAPLCAGSPGVLHGNRTYLMEDRDGQIIDVLLRSVAINPLNLDEGVIFTGLDITDLNRTVEELRIKEQQVRLLLECSGEAVFGIDLDGSCTFVNPTCLKLLGYQDDSEVLGENCHDLFHHSQADHSHCPEQECNVARAFRHGVAVHMAGEVFWRRDGSSFPVEYRSSPIVRNNEIIGSVVNFVDITERKRYEDELRQALSSAQQAQAHVDAILHSAADGMIVVTPDLQVSMVNDVAGRLLSGEGSLRDIACLEQTFAGTPIPAKVQAVFSGQPAIEPFDLQGPCLSGVGDEQVVEVRITAMCAEDHTVNGAIITLRDVTRERQLDKLKDEFISIAAHELRTPMTAILGYTELILDQLSDLDETMLREFLGIIHERSNTLSVIIADMLDLSRVQSGRLISLDMSVGDFSGLLRQSVVPYRIEGARHIFLVKVNGRVRPSIFDQNKMAQVLDNLLSNSVKFSPAGGTIRVQGDFGDDQVTVSVTDQGIGMTSEQCVRIFDKFYRADCSNTAISGLGLGMSLVKAIVEAHGGRIWVDSKVGVGTSACFSLPLSRGESAGCSA
ncbi:MAG: hypothetical protein C0614_14340, partial [Desulfuromonas sp.]